MAKHVSEHEGEPDFLAPILKKKKSKLIQAPEEKPSQEQEDAYLEKQKRWLRIDNDALFSDLGQ